MEESARNIHRKVVGYALKEIDGLHDEIASLKAQLKAAREALEFYADEKNYNDDGAPYSEVVREGQECDELDLGDVAKAELEGGKT